VKKYRPRYNTGWLPPAESLPEQVANLFDDYRRITAAVDDALGQVDAATSREVMAAAEQTDRDAMAAAIRAGKPMPKVSALDKARAAAEKAVATYDAHVAAAESIEADIADALASHQTSDDRAEVTRLSAAMTTLIDALEKLAEAGDTFEVAIADVDAVRKLRNGTDGYRYIPIDDPQFRRALSIDELTARVADDAHAAAALAGVTL
jgi:hypothetical protein